MSTTINLNQNAVFDLEPSEGDDTNGNWISPFGVPRGIQIWNDVSGNIRCIEFEYLGGEIGYSRELLDDRNDPPVQVLITRRTKKIMQLVFGNTITQNEFPRIAERLNRKSELVDMMGVKFNHIIISKILENWNVVTDRMG